MKISIWISFLFTGVFYFSELKAQSTIWPIETLRTDITGAWIRTGDFDNDGDPDILIQSGDSIFWHENLKPGWAPHLIDSTFYNSFAGWVDVMDLDNDGDPDVLKVPISDQTPNPLTWNENLSNGASWENHLILHTPNFIGWMQHAYGDLDGDNDIDIIVPEYNMENTGSLYWLENENGSPNFIRHPLVSGNIYSSSLADLDGDGDLDIVTGVNDVHWLENLLPDTAWTSHEVAGPGFSPYLIGTCSDFNSDGTVDILANPHSGGDDSLIYYSNPGWQVRSIHPGTGIFLGETGDLDNDGDLDVTYGGGGFTGIPLALGWAENQNAGTQWILHDITDTTTHQIFCSGLADFDGDGDLDMVSIDLNTNIGLASVFWAANPLIIMGTSEQAQSAFRFSMTPNPAGDFTYICIEHEKKGAALIQLFDMTGNRLRELEMNAGTPETLTISDLPAGTYLVRIMRPEGTAVRKLIKQ